MINASFSTPQLLSLLGREDLASAQIADEVVAKLTKQMQGVHAGAAQAATGSGDTGQGVVVGPTKAQSLEQLGAKTMHLDSARDQEALNRTREVLAQLERDTMLCAEDLAVQERRLARARQQFAAVGATEDWGWTDIWQENVRHAREGYEDMQALLREMRARYAPLVASLEASLEHSHAAAGATSQCQN